MDTVEEQTLLRCQYLLDKNYCCFTISLDVDEKDRLIIKVSDKASEKLYQLDLGKFLLVLQKFAFQRSIFPIVLNFVLPAGFDRFEELRTALDFNLKNYNVLNSQFSPKKLAKTILVYFTVLESDELNVGNLLASQEVNQIELDVASFEDLYNIKDKRKSAI